MIGNLIKKDNSKFLFPKLVGINIKKNCLLLNEKSFFFINKFEGLNITNKDNNLREKSDFAEGDKNSIYSNSSSCYKLSQDKNLKKGIIFHLGYSNLINKDKYDSINNIKNNINTYFKEKLIKIDSRSHSRNEKANGIYIYFLY